MRRILTVAAIAVAVLLGGFACSHSAASSHHVAKAKASVSAAAHNPAVVKAEKHAEKLIINCAAKVPVHVAHPFKTAEAILRCADPKGSRAALKACARRVLLKSGANEAADLKGLAGCIDGVKSQ